MKKACVVILVLIMFTTKTFSQSVSKEVVNLKELTSSLNTNKSIYYSDKQHLDSILTVLKTTALQKIRVVLHTNSGNYYATVDDIKSLRITDINSGLMMANESKGTNRSFDKLYIFKLN